MIPASPAPHPALAKLLLLDRLQDLCRQAGCQSPELPFFTRLMQALAVSWDCPPSDTLQIPRAGAAVIVANHPFGMIEGIVLGALLAQIRPDVKFLANSLLLKFDELRDLIIPVNPFGGNGAVKTNWRPLREAVAHLRRGGLLVTFPAGEVSALRLNPPGVFDAEWNENIADLIRLSGAAVVPLFFHGANSVAFHLAGLIHPKLRTLALPSQLLNKRGRRIRISIGGAVDADSLAHLTKRQAIDYLRHRTQLLGLRGETHPQRPCRSAEIARAVGSHALAAEITALPPEQVLLQSGGLTVCYARAGQIPNALHEIGRLREIAFRRVNEGTGRALDLDRFDRHYTHLILWNRERAEIAGAYRLASTDKTPELYTSTLFRIHPQFFRALGPALELGRSFISPEYQKSYSPLLLLWKGIGHYVARFPEYRMLFGPVSISRAYCPASRDLIVHFMKNRCDLPHLARFVKPKRRFHADARSARDIRVIAPALDNVDHLSAVIADLEADRKGVPILLRQYLNVGGRILEFNVDPEFSDVLDGLIVVDLVNTERRLLQRYLGVEGSERFLAVQAERRAG